MHDIVSCKEGSRCNDAIFVLGTTSTANTRHSNPDRDGGEKSERRRKIKKKEERIEKKIRERKEGKTKHQEPKKQIRITVCNK